MKKIKGVGAVILAAMILLCLNFTGVLAAKDASGRDSEKDVSLTIYKYEYNEELFEGIENNGAPQTIPGTAKGVGGVTFKIEKVTLKDGASATSNDPNNYEPVTGTGAFSTTGTTDAFGKVVFSTDTDSNTATDALLGQGIYKVTEVKSATIGTKPIADFIVSLPMANPDTAEGADPWLYDVYAYPKNDIEKAIDKEVVETGTNDNIAKWKYSVIIPNDIKTSPTSSENLVITDELDYRLLYITDSITGYYTDKDGTEYSLIMSTDNGLTGDYTLTKTPSTDTGSNPIEVLEISITKAGFAKLEAALTAGNGNITPTLYFTLETRTNIGSDVSDLGEIYNGGELDYTNSAGHEYDTETIPDPDKPKMDTYGIKICKINVNNEFLANAKFNLYTDETAAIAKDTTKALKKPDGSAVWEIITGTNGYAYFYGLDEGTYYLVETDAPSGYNLLSDPITVVISTDEVNGTVAADRTVEVKVTNKKGFVLPATGGIGTILFTLVGLALIGTAVTLLLIAKRRRARKNIGFN